MLRSRIILLILLSGVELTCHREELKTISCYEDHLEKISRLPNGFIQDGPEEIWTQIPCAIDLTVTPEIAEFAKKLRKRVDRPEQELLRELSSGVECKLLEIFEDENIVLLPGRDSSYSSLFTGYYTPMYNASTIKDSIYQVPIFSNELSYTIDTTIVPGLGKSDSIIIDSIIQQREIVYLRNYFERYQLYLQGSALIELENGDQKYLVFEKSNAYPFVSLNKLIRRNDTLPPLRRYGLDALRKYYFTHSHILDSLFSSDPYQCYYRIDDRAINSALGIQLVENLSVAVDTDFHELGSVFVAELPQINSKGRLVSYEYRFLIGSDVGSFIDKSYKFDVYCGTGPNKGEKAQNINHYGRIWKIQKL